VAAVPGGLSLTALKNTPLSHSLYIWESSKDDFEDCSHDAAQVKVDVLLFGEVWFLD
jgi:hypothetical protein